VSRPPEQPYAVLQLKPGAPIDEVRLAYRHLAAQWHPDRFRGDPARQEEARTRLQQLREAYDAVCDARDGEGEQSAPARVTSGARSSILNRMNWRIPAGIAVVLVLVAVAVLFPPMPAPDKMEPPVRSASTRPLADDVNSAPVTAAPVPVVSAVKETPLPWTVHADAPAAPITPDAGPLFPTNASAQIAPVIWVPASSNAAAAGMSWSLTPPGLRPRAVPASSGDKAVP
jgi:hypothetical protein